MNLIILFDDDFISDSSVKLEGRRAKHINSIHRAGTGDVLHIGMLNGKIGVGTLTSLSRDSITMQTDFSYNIKVPSPMPLTLILALPRPQTLKKVIESSTSMGIKEIILINSSKVEKSYWQSTLLKDNNLEKHVLLGLEQGKDTIMPAISFKKYFKPFIQDEAPKLLHHNTLPLIAHPGARESCPYKVEQHATLAIGPESGFTDYEVEAFKEAGFMPVNIGEHILRVEYAIPFIAGKLF